MAALFGSNVGGKKERLLQSYLMWVANTIRVNGNNQYLYFEKNR